MMEERKLARGDTLFGSTHALDTVLSKPATASESINTRDFLSKYKTSMNDQQQLAVKSNNVGVALGKTGESDDDESRSLLFGGKPSTTKKTSSVLSFFHKNGKESIPISSIASGNKEPFQKIGEGEDVDEVVVKIQPPYFKSQRPKKGNIFDDV